MHHMWLGLEIAAVSNYRAALDAGRALCLYSWQRRPGASERGR
jgi:hypothetical protein